MAERVRFSPAPTGDLHLGGAHTALFNHLVARHSGGSFILRFEDTDELRADARFERSIEEDLAWLGIAVDEGPGPGGAHAPYRQSERSALYADALRRLLATGRAYPCFCGEEELAAGRSADAEEGRAPRYRGACRALDPAEAAARVDAGEPHCWRFAVPDAGEIVVADAVHGDVRFRCDEIGDFVIARSGGGALYDLACVVDDAAMGVTLVVRGDDHLANTPRQLLLFAALGLTAPRYAHLPLVRGADGRPLSKSRGSQAVAELRGDGYLPAAVVNHLALLGWSAPSGAEVLTPAEIVDAFELERVSPSPSAHDPARLRWMNARHMAALTPEGRAALLIPFLPPLPGADAETAARLVADEVEVAGDARDLLAWVAAPLPRDGEADAALAAAAGPRALAAARDAVGGAPDALRTALRYEGLAARDAMPAIRAALTGRAHGLPLSTVIALLGAEEARRRIVAVLSA